jgi:hypothetical protein
MKYLITLLIISFYSISSLAVECIEKKNHFHPKALAKRGSFWPNGKNLNIYFTEGTIDQKKFVIQNATLWTNYANLTFTFHPNETPQSDADVIISFAGNGNYSNIGTDSESEAHALKTTMNLEVVRNLDSERERDIGIRTVQHEFGHVLGFLHEHQSPYRSIKINHTMAQRLCSTIGWSEKDCEDNVIKQYSEEETIATAFDFKSVMLYPMKRSVYSGWIINDNWQISTTDKIMAALIYPGKLAVIDGKSILKVDRIIKSHRSFGKFFKVKDISDLNAQTIDTAFDRLDDISLGYVPPESIISVSLKFKLAKVKSNKDIIIEIKADDESLGTVVIPKDYPDKKEIEFKIPEFKLHNLHSDNESIIQLSTDSDFLFIGMNLEIETLQIKDLNHEL